MHLSNMHFFYDAQGKPCQVNYGGTIYNYVLNVQGDVVGLTDASGNLVVEYKYDAWGKLLGISGSLATSVGVDTPLRYRGYVYDTETGLYYLHSRYYNPETKRFVSADILMGEMGTIHSTNIFAYCRNEPVMHSDHYGYSPISDFLQDVFCGINEAYIQNARNEYKSSISFASNLGLSVMDYPLANSFFNHFLWGNGKSPGKETLNSLSKALSNSSVLLEKIKKDFVSYGDIILSSIEFKSGDLHYAVGAAGYLATVIQGRDSITISGVLWDRYDFTEWRTEDSGFSWFSMQANNLGYQLQHDNFGYDFYYRVPFEIKIPIK